MRSSHTLVFIFSYHMKHFLKNAHLVGKMVAITRGKKGAVVILGFNRHTPTDVLRIREMAKHWDVFTVSRVRERGHPGHLECSFVDIEKGPKSQILNLVTEKSLRFNVLKVHLDYWWPANGYFADSYGKKWLTKWVQQLLDAGACQVLIPYNKEVEEMEQDPHALIGEHLRREQSELWCASKKAQGIKQKFHNFKMTGLHAETPFLRFQKKGAIVYIYPYNEVHSFFVFI
jgi:hypothetical protein